MKMYPSMDPNSEKYLHDPDRVWCGGRWVTLEQAEKHREANRRYEQSEKGREARRRYEQSEKRREARRARGFERYWSDPVWRQVQNIRTCISANKRRRRLLHGE